MCVNKRTTNAAVLGDCGRHEHSYILVVFKWDAVCLG